MRTLFFSLFFVLSCSVAHALLSLQTTELICCSSHIFFFLFSPFFSLSLQEIEEEMARTQKNKATEHHLGKLKMKLAMYRAKLLEPEGGGGGKSEGFDVGKHGDARVALVGFPSVGKSTLLTEMTDTKSDSAAYAFTTVTAIPGNIFYQGATIQMLDLPGIIEGAAYGKVRFEFRRCKRFFFFFFFHPSSFSRAVVAK